MMLVNAREFVGASLLRNAVEDIERGLYRPADKQRRGSILSFIVSPCASLKPFNPIAIISNLFAVCKNILVSVFISVFERNCIKYDVIMQVIFIYMGCKHNLKSVCK